MCGNEKQDVIVYMCDQTLGALEVSVCGLILSLSSRPHFKYFMHIIYIIMIIIYNSICHISYIIYYIYYVII